MYCPKCATENPDNGKFCRKCGTDLKVISDVMSGKLTANDHHKEKKKKKEPSWELALFMLSTSLAFFITAIILAFQPMGAGWWFWLLFAAFPMLAIGVGQIISLKQNKENNIKISSDKNVTLPASENTNSLPPKQTEFVTDFPDTKHKTGDLVPPSVVEETTRKLEMNSEGETIDQPKKDK